VPILILIRILFLGYFHNGAFLILPHRSPLRLLLLFGVRFLNSSALRFRIPVRFVCCSFQREILLRKMCISSLFTRGNVFQQFCLRAQPFCRFFTCASFLSFLFCIQVVTMAFKDEPKILKITAEVVVARDSQKGILIGKKVNLKRLAPYSRP